MNRNKNIDISTSFPTQKDIIRVKLMISYFLSSDNSIEDATNSHYITITNKTTNIKTVIFWSSLLYGYIVPCVIEYAFDKKLFSETERDDAMINLMHYWKTTGKSPIVPLWDLFLAAQKVDFPDSDFNFLVDITNAKYEADKNIKADKITNKNLTLDFEKKAIVLPETLQTCEEFPKDFVVKKTTVKGFCAEQVNINNINANYSKQKL